MVSRSLADFATVVLTSGCEEYMSLIVFAIISDQCLKFTYPEILAQHLIKLNLNLVFLIVLRESRFVVSAVTIASPSFTILFYSITRLA